MSELAVVTGGTGVIGSPLVAGLQRGGFRVRALATGVPATARQADAELLRADVRDRSAMLQAVDGARLVVHLAAKLHVPDAGPELEAEYHSVNVVGTENVALAAAEAGVDRLIVLSSIDVYGPSIRGAVLDERAAPNPRSLYAKTKLRAEAAAAVFGRPTILRMASVYGPGMKGNYLRMLEAIRRRRFPIIGDGLNRRTLVHLDDAVGAVLEAATSERVVEGTFNVTDGSQHTLRQIADSMTEALGLPRIRLQIPMAAAGGIARLGERVLGRRAPITTGTIDKLTEDLAVSGDRFMEVTGFRPDVDLHRGWRSVVAWYLGRSGDAAPADKRR